MENESASLKELILSYAVQRPSEVPSLYSILKTIVLPALGHRNLTTDKAKELAATTPAFRLYGLIELDGTAWTRDLRKRLPPGETYQKAYLRAIKRVIAHGEELGMLHPDEYAIAPEWRSLIAALDSLSVEYSVGRRSGLRTAFKRLASWATQNEILPADIPLIDDDGRRMQDFLRTFPPDRDSGFYRARIAWNLLFEAYPDWGLRAWEEERSLRCRGLPREQWPFVMQRGLELLLNGNRLEVWSEATQKGYESTFAIYLGALRDLGIDLEALLTDIVDERMALRLLFQGFPPGYPRTEGVAHVQQLIAAPEQKAGFLDSLQALEGVYEGRASDSNPLILAAARAMVEERRVSSAFNLFVKALAINRNVLAMTERHAEWCKKGRNQLSQTVRRMPSAYALKKRNVFRHPMLWADLVAARTRLRAHTLALEAKWHESLGAQAWSMQDQWAVALRNEIFFGMILCYPLRAANFSKMRLDRHYDCTRHRIFFPREETKNDKDIDYELPEGGSLGDLRELVHVYLEQARPVLLAGRDSPYFFVPNRIGGTCIPTRGFNLILGIISRQFLQDLLPEGVRELNPHLLRHAAANYHLTIGQNLNLAAQILNDSPSTVTKSYADVLEHRKEATKRFLSGFNVPPR